MTVANERASCTRHVETQKSARSSSTAGGLARVHAERKNTRSVLLGMLHSLSDTAPASPPRPLMPQCCTSVQCGDSVALDFEGLLLLGSRQHSTTQTTA